MQFAIAVIVTAAISIFSVLEATPSRSQMIANFKRITDNGIRLRRNVDSVPTTSDNTFQINDTARHGNKKYWFSRNSMNLKFVLPASLKKRAPESLRSATLVLHRRRPSSDSGPLLLKVTMKMRKGDSIKQITVATKRLAPETWGEIRVKVTRAVAFWAKRGRRHNRGLTVSIVDPSAGQDKRSKSKQSAVFSLQQPKISLVVVLNEPRSPASSETDNDKRSPANVEESDCLQTQGKCCRKELVVSFAELGWDWVISPTHVDIGLCSGDCPNNFRSANWHSVLKSKLAARNPDNQDLSASCSPKTFSPISIMHYDADGVLVTTPYSDMSVNTCACA